MRTLFHNKKTLAFLACLLFSTAFVNIKIGLEFITPVWFAGFRFVAAGLVIAPFARKIKENFSEFRKHWFTVISVGFFMTFLQYSLLYTGVKLVDSSIAAILNGSSPIFVAIVAHLMMDNDKFTLKKIIVSLLGLFGIILITYEKTGLKFSNNIYYIGILILVFVNLSSAIGNVIVAKKASMKNPIALSSYQLFTGGIMLCIFAYFTEPLPVKIIEPSFYISLSWLIIVSAVAVSLWIILLQSPDQKVSDLNIWKFVIPVLGATWSWLIIDSDKPGWFSIAGMALVAGAIIILNMEKGDKSILPSE